MCLLPWEPRSPPAPDAQAHRDPQPAEPASPTPHARLHDLRHIHATTLLLAGVPVHVVAARLGHADPAITLRIYAYVLPEQAATAADGPSEDERLC
ncbi:tyrosine-type recombinase/integrase [Nonomuraea rubra]